MSAMSSVHAMYKAWMATGGDSESVYLTGHISESAQTQRLVHTEKRTRCVEVATQKDIKHDTNRNPSLPE